MLNSFEANGRHISTAYLGQALGFEEALECLISFLVSAHSKILIFCVVFSVIRKLSPVVWNPFKQNSPGAVNRWSAK